jgi:hypothetical protein
MKAITITSGLPCISAKLATSKTRIVSSKIA